MRVAVLQLDSFLKGNNIYNPELMLQGYFNPRHWHHYLSENIASNLHRQNQQTHFTLKCTTGNIIYAPVTFHIKFQQDAATIKQQSDQRSILG